MLTVCCIQHASIITHSFLGRGGTEINKTNVITQLAKLQHTHFSIKLSCMQRATLYKVYIAMVQAVGSTYSIL